MRKLDRIRRDLQHLKSPAKQDIAAGNETFHFTILTGLAHAAADIDHRVIVAALGAEAASSADRNEQGRDCCPARPSARALHARDEGAARDAMVADLRVGGGRILGERRTLVAPASRLTAVKTR